MGSKTIFNSKFTWSKVCTNLSIFCYLCFNLWSLFRNVFRNVWIIFTHLPTIWTPRLNFALRTMTKVQSMTGSQSYIMQATRHWVSKVHTKTEVFDFLFSNIKEATGKWIILSSSLVYQSQCSKHTDLLNSSGIYSVMLKSRLDQ